MKLLLPTIVLLSFMSCTKTSVKSEDAAKNFGCSSSTKATVKKEMLNETGTEYFYYLEVETNIGGSNRVFPDLIPTNFQEVGKRLNIRYNSTEEKHTYIQCLAGHTMDPNNPDYVSMPLVQVCNATALN